jgi:hypothetical protein
MHLSGADFLCEKMMPTATYPHSHWWVCCTYVEALVNHKCTTHLDVTNDEKATAAAQLEASACDTQRVDDYLIGHHSICKEAGLGRLPLSLPHVEIWTPSAKHT